jgi:beta-glucosidase
MGGEQGRSGLTGAVPRSRILDLTQPDAFVWSTGIEDTFIFDPHRSTARILDEYALTEHYERWREDLDLIAATGVRTTRYGIPWYRVNPAPGEWDWGWADQTIGRLLELGIDPIVDLVHYGTPGWVEGAFTHPRYPAYVSEYASRFAERFHGRVRWYTPLNEPRITAWYCGKLGWWPPYGRGWPGFLSVLMGACRGIVETDRALSAVDPEIVKVHVDATDVYRAAIPELEADAHFRQELVFLALDLVFGRVNESHSLWGWLMRQGVKETELEWFLEHGVEPDIVGINLYPMFTNKRVLRTPSGIRVRMRYGEGTIVEELGRMYWERYRRPIIVTETASVGSVKRRLAWLEDSLAAVQDLRRAGIPLIGYTWWPLFALVSWGYRQGKLELREYLMQMGLWDLRPDLAGRLNREETPLVRAYRTAVEGGSASVGSLLASEPIGGRT